MVTRPDNLQFGLIINCWGAARRCNRCAADRAGARHHGQLAVHRAATTRAHRTRPWLDVTNTFVVVFAPNVSRSMEVDAEDIRSLRALPGVAAATVISAVPLSGAAVDRIFHRAREKGQKTPVNCSTRGCRPRCAAGRGRNFDASAITKPKDRSSPGEVILTESSPNFRRQPRSARPCMTVSASCAGRRYVNHARLVAHRDKLDHGHTTRSLQM
jgi:hypothetical protein